LLSDLGVPAYDILRIHGADGGVKTLLLADDRPAWPGESSIGGNFGVG
jgi:hypothetical protein